jgi:hypothetical protein
MAAASVGPFVGESNFFGRPLLHEQLVRCVKEEKTESPMRLPHPDFLVQVAIQFCRASNYIIIVVN